MTPEILTEYVTINGKQFIRHYCEGYTIIQIETGIEYGDAIDVIPCKYTYKVGNKEVLPEENAQEEVI